MDRQVFFEGNIFSVFFCRNTRKVCIDFTCICVSVYVRKALTCSVLVSRLADGDVTVCWSPLRPSLTESCSDCPYLDAAWVSPKHEGEQCLGESVSTHLLHCRRESCLLYYSTLCLLMTATYPKEQEERKHGPCLL